MMNENDIQDLAFHVRWFITQADTNEKMVERYKKVYDFLVANGYDPTKH